MIKMTPELLPIMSYMQNRRHDLRILGDWTINYVWDNRHELLLSKKYDAYQLMDIVIRKFYEFAGIEFPEWLGRWIAWRLRLKNWMLMKKVSSEPFCLIVSTKYCDRTLIY